MPYTTAENAEKKLLEINTKLKQEEDAILQSIVNCINVATETWLEWHGPKATGNHDACEILFISKEAAISAAKRLLNFFGAGP